MKKEILVATRFFKDFPADMDTAFSFLALMIAENRDTGFWFGSSDGTVKGDIILYINTAKWCITIDQYKTPYAHDWSDNFYLLSEPEQKEIEEKYCNSGISPHEKFMLEYGNDLLNEKV